MASERLRRAAERGDLGDVAAALGAGADLASGDRASGETALHLAARRGHLEVVAFLLARGADPLAHDAGTMTPLHVAARDGRASVVALLLDRIQWTGELLRDVLFVASGSVRGRPEVVDLLERALDDAHRRAAGMSPRVAAVAEDGDPDAPSEETATPDGELVLAVQRGDPAAVRRALDRGAGVEAPGPTGATPLILAAQSGNAEIVRLLLAAGADPTCTHVGGNTAADLANRGLHGEAALVHLLRRAEVLWCLKARRRYLRGFAHEIEHRPGQERFIFFDGEWFVSAWWNPTDQRLHGARGWTEPELVALLARGTYRGAVVGDFTRGPIGEYAAIPDLVLATAPALARRFLQVVESLADGTQELELVRVAGWVLRCSCGQWSWGPRGLPDGRPSDALQPIASDFAMDLIEETLIARTS